VKKSADMASRSGAIIVLLAFIACGGGEGGGGGPGPMGPNGPSTITANSSTTLTGVAGSVVSPSPSIIVKDQNGTALAGVAVTFGVTSGGGSVSGGAVTSDASGIATVGSWTLGTTAGANVLSASVASLTAVTFTATATAGAAATMTKTAGDNQSGAPGTAVAVPPSVTVNDAHGNPKSNIVVTFAVASGGGSVAGGSATTNASGVATVGSWTLGGSAGSNTLTASTPGVASVTFTATGANPNCGVATAHTLGTVTSGTLSTSDCQLSDGTYVDFFSTTIGEANAYLFRQGAVFDTYLYLAGSDGFIIAENDDENGTTTNSAIKALLPSGSYLLGASSFDAAVTGGYQISSVTTSTAVTGCELVFVVKNVSTTQNIEANDCLGSTPPAPAIYADTYFIFLRTGQSLTVTMSSDAVDSFLEIIRLGGPTVASNDNIDATTKNARVTYTATANTYYTIFARTAISGQTGSYTLNVQ
jgi:hypothetical protein